MKVVVEEKELRTAHMEPENSSFSLGSGSRLPVVTQLSSHTTTIQCPQCGSQRVWKDGLRYNPLGEIQRYLCRDCAYRFSHTQQNNGSQLSEALQGSSRLILCRSGDILSTRNRLSGVNHTGEAAFTTTTKPGPEIRRESCGQHEAVKDMESRIQETAAGATPKTIDEMKGKIVEYAWWLKKEGYSEATILGRSRLLKILVKRGANLYDPDAFKDALARQNWSVGRKANAADAYTTFLKMLGGKWDPPRYTRVDKIPFISTETEVDQLIAGCSKRMGTFLQLLKETGIRAGEAWVLKWIDVDTVSRVVRITPEKNSNPRIFHTSQKLAAMFEALPRTYGDRVFSTPQQPVDHHRDHFTQQRKRIANKLKNPRLMQIHFHTLRHWKGTMEYHRTKDPYHVMTILGHKRIQNTLKYIHLAEELFKDQQEYVSKVAKTEADACNLIEAGFEFVCDFNSAKLFRKPKN